MKLTFRTCYDRQTDQQTDRQGINYIAIYLAPIWYNRAIEAYNQHNLQLLHEYALVFIDLLRDLDAILATNENFMLGPWLGECIEIQGFP